MCGFDASIRELVNTGTLRSVRMTWGHCDSLPRTRPQRRKKRATILDHRRKLVRESTLASNAAGGPVRGSHHRIGILWRCVRDGNLAPSSLLKGVENTARPRRSDVEQRELSVDELLLSQAVASEARRIGRQINARLAGLLIDRSERAAAEQNAREQSRSEESHYAILFGPRFSRATLSAVRYDDPTKRIADRLGLNQ